METYSFLRAMADSWFLLLMTLFFVGMILYTLRPGSRRVHDDIAQIPLRNDDALPADGAASPPSKE
ncbi:MAG: cbb3-type cytochrome c oxidase subunit 3 [Pseudomonadota bacterium]